MILREMDYIVMFLKVGTQSNENLKKELIQTIRSKIGPIATPDFIHFTDGLPKTRSGKIMRRILRKIAANEHDQLEILQLWQILVLLKN